MNKSEFIEQIAAEAGISKKAAAAALDSVMSVVTSTLKKGGHVTLAGFGKFSAVQRRARIGTNPRTGAQMAIKAKVVPVFAPGATLKNAMLYGQQLLAQ